MPTRFEQVKALTPPWLKSMTRRPWLFLRFRIRLIAKFFPIFFGLNELDRKVLTYVDFEDGYFVELGANDGVSQSNTKHFELFRNWRGVLVEPNFENYKRCKRFRSRKTKVFNAACVSFEYSSDKVEMLYSNLMTIALNGESDIEDRRGHADKGTQFLAETEEVYSFHAPARTLNSILLEAKSPKIIDLLSLDVEGGELEVLKGVDHNEFRFRYILIECRNYSEMDQFLTAREYSFVDQLTGHDYLFADSRRSASTKG